MVERRHKPSALAASTSLPPQAQVSISHNNSRVAAELPTGERIEVLLHGATVISWRDSQGNEKLWLSEASKLDGSKAVRGGIPLVFPVFGTAPDHEVNGKLPQHGFARNVRWEFLGKSTSEGSSSSSVKLDFCLSPENLDHATREKWPYQFGLLYSVTLDVDSLNTSLVVTNEGDEPFECHALFHTYFKIDDISTVHITGLENAPYIDKVDGARTKTQAAGPVTFHGETDRVYMPANDSKDPITIHDKSGRAFVVMHDNLDNAVVWNPWTEKAAGMSDFEPKHGWKHMVCVERGRVMDWAKLEKGDTFQGGQTIHLP